MAGKFRFELVSPERVLLSVDADQVVVPGNDGKRLFVKSGFAEVDAFRLTVLAEKAYDVEELSAATIADELKTAEAEFATAKDDSSKRMADTLVTELKRLSAKAA